MPYELQPCELADAAAIARVNMTAFWQDKTWRLNWSHKDLKLLISRNTLRMPWNLTKNPRARHQKAVDTETGEVVGYARWDLPNNSDCESIWVEARGPAVSEEEFKDIVAVSEGVEWKTDPITDVLDPGIIALTKPFKDDKNYMGLGYLAVHPDHQRKGIGSLLIASGVEVADAVGLEIYVTALSPGLKAYQNAGFQIRGHITQDASAIGGDKEYHTYALVRKCGAIDGKNSAAIV